MSINRLNLIIKKRIRIILLSINLSLFFVSPSFAQYNYFGTAFEGGYGLSYMQSARTYGKGHYAIGIQSLTMQREYYFFNSFTTRINNEIVIGVPATIGITDFIDFSTGFYFFHDARPYNNDSNIYEYHGFSESRIGSTRLGLKLRLPLSEERKIQIAGKIFAIVNTSKEQIDGMNYRWTRKKGTDIETSILETININSYMNLHLEQGYVLSGSDIYDDQLVLAAGINVCPFNKWSLGLELHNRTFIGVSPQSLVKSTYEPTKYWDSITHFGNPTYIKDSDLNFTEDFFVAIPSISYRVNELISLNAGAVINTADQKGLKVPLQILLGITLNGDLGFMADSDGDGINNNIDKEPNTHKGYPVDKFGVTLDIDGDGIPDKIDKQLLTPKGAIVDQNGVAIDSDGDGVYNGIDKEPNTPKGYKVDINGMTLDSDGDGVPNSIDREANTPRGVPVDAYGVTMEKELVPKTVIPQITTKKEVVVEKSLYSVHVSSYRNIAGANKEVEDYRKRGYDAFTIFTTIPGMGNWYRVFVGRFRTELEAATEAQSLLNLGLTKYAKVMKTD